MTRGQYERGRALAIKAMAEINGKGPRYFDWVAWSEWAGSEAVNAIKNGLGYESLEKKEGE